MNNTKKNAILSYYFAISLDGYLARKDDTIDWLSKFDQEFDTPFSYKKYYETVDAVLIGRKTYEIAKIFESNPYADKPLYLITHNVQYSIPHPNYQILTNKFKDLVEKLKFSYSKRIWVVGGGEIATLLNSWQLIDEIIVTIMPYLLGDGIRWLNPHSNENPWFLKGMWSTPGGVVQLQYEKIAHDNN